MTEYDPDELFELLGDEYVRDILTAASRDAMSVKELSEVCDSSLATVYRRVDDLREQGLLVEKTRIVEDGSHHNVYETRLDHLGIDIKDGAFRIEAEFREDPAERFTRMWEDIRST